MWKACSKVVEPTARVCQQVESMGARLMNQLFECPVDYGSIVIKSHPLRCNSCHISPSWVKADHLNALICLFIDGKKKKSKETLMQRREGFRPRLSHCPSRLYSLMLLVFTPAVWPRGDWPSTMKCVEIIGWPPANALVSKTNKSTSLWRARTVWVL